MLMLHVHVVKEVALLWGSISIIEHALKLADQQYTGR